MDSLKSLMASSSESNVEVADVKAVAGGTLLMTGCHDYENATSKAPEGLDEPHKIVLPHAVKQSFSSSSSFHSFFLSVEGILYAVGRNDHGQLGTGDIITYPSPVVLPSSGLFPTGSVIVKVATGRSHSLILLDSGEVYGCGSNTQGQLGLGDTKTALKDALRFVRITALSNIRDISCGYDHSIACDRSGRVFTFGHPQFGQLGHGTDGSFIKDGGKGAAMQFRFVFNPRQVEKFLVKDSHSKITAEIPASDVNIRVVGAGKNHSVCVEEWENEGMNRVFSFGFGGYGRLGHNVGNDEVCPREIVMFQTLVGGKQVPPANPQKQIHQIVCGSTFSMTISKSKHLYFWGKLSNSQRGEATMYPKLEMNLHGWNTRLVAGGSNSIFVAADDSCMAWGVPVAGKFGLEGGAKSTVSAKFVEALAGLTVSDISCGYGHITFVVSATGSVAETKLAAMPELAVSTPSTAKASTSAKETKKRGAPAAEVKEVKKKGKGK
mmetsp:Transcript_13778/g.13317  ORF Transcript_13778/g.13317 Transcript_13778/m.13317 type:complete len:493 (+) Transcript_13778:92-1570(+)|eukprot:CAMPEP_0119037506 /NCGR_PEP_ID=MMETSP1177-20130426/5893_1 /TAXON_ID=2985 /ORGANISM="Ochromonas sp, Strain CCMP1899" /LENGTH=492 /DNA_ID=CAMNT_0006998869 /DNA_START=31 /DNA_END=1509 /DNA_ORIENTATION=+